VTPFAQDPGAADGSSAGNSLQTPASSSLEKRELVTLPGPLLFFQRMAAISRKATPEEVLPFLARNVVVDGYHNVNDDNRKPTEFLKLLQAYLGQARELQGMADAEGHIRVSGCADAQPLLQALGYRLRTPCGPDTSVEVLDPKRAFLTVDAGFPLVDLEEALRDGKPFQYEFGTSSLPVLFSQNEWAWKDQNLIDAILGDPALARLYWALSRLDEETQQALRQSPGLQRLVPLAPILDFYGSHLVVRRGRVVVPGGTAGEPAWRSLVGADPSSPDEFLVKLLERDQGWLAAFFDALSFVPREKQSYFNDTGRLKRFYEALRGKDSGSPARTVFRPTANLYLLTSRLVLDENGKPDVPGGLEVWKEIFRRKSDSKLVRDWAKRSNGWNQPEHLLEALFSLSRVPVDEGPLQIYLQLTEIDRRRAPGQGLGVQAVRLMAEKFTRFRHQYLLFTEFPELDDASISRFLSIADILDRVRDDRVRANAMGLFQANVGLWQIFARQEQIPRNNLNASFQRVLQPFANVKNSEQAFDAGRTALQELWLAAGGASSPTHSEMIAMLAGPPQSSSAGQQMHQEVSDRLRSAFDDQRLVPLDTLLGLADGLQQLAQGQAMSDSLIRMAGALREFELPQPMFTRRERTEWASGLQHNPYTSLQTRVDLTKVIAQPNRSAKDLAEARGMLAPFLRDTLVGFNYIYYEPPGAQMIRSNPLLVRSHNFAQEMTMKGDEVWQTPRVLGRGWSASGGAHLVGSMADLPYVLAQLEQDFIVPENVQSLIWADLVPTILTSAALPRWWQVSENELRAVALYQQLGEDLLAASIREEAARSKVLNLLWDYLLPSRLGRLERFLQAGQADQAVALLMPSELFVLGSSIARSEPAFAESSGEAGRQLVALIRDFPDQVNPDRVARDFGVPHPMLAQTYARELIATKPLPTFLGYSSRLLAECWESSNLYWARLAVEKNQPPAALHRLVPMLTHRMVEKIFATHLEDWPAVLRAMREAGEEFLAGRPAPGVPMEAAEAAEIHTLP
jgi:hypothetical protein